MTISTDASLRSRRVLALLALSFGVLASACGDGSKHATDGDTGAAAPATVRDMSTTPNVGDSTTGVSAPTGAPQVSGDTMGSRARGDSQPRP